MINGISVVELGTRAYDEAATEGIMPTADAVLTEQALRHARFEAVVRFFAARGFALISTSLLKAADRGEIPAPTSGLHPGPRVL